MYIFGLFWISLSHEPYEEMKKKKKVARGGGGGVPRECVPLTFLLVVEKFPRTDLTDLCYLPAGTRRTIPILATALNLQCFRI